MQAHANLNIMLAFCPLMIELKKYMNSIDMNMK